MSTAYLSDEDFTQIVLAAIRLNEKGIAPSNEEIAAIADGDEDIPQIIKWLDAERFALWDTLETGVYLLQKEREIDRVDMGEAGSPLAKAVLKMQVVGIDILFDGFGKLRWYPQSEDEMLEGVSYQRQNGRLYFTPSANDILVAANQDLSELMLTSEEAVFKGHPGLQND